MHYGKFIEDINEVGAIDKIFQDVAMNSIEALGGSSSALKNLYDIFVGAGSKFRDVVFYVNLHKFLKALNLDDERQAFLREVLNGDEGTYVNTRRLLQCIERIETETKIDYIVNATLALLDKKINIGDYFRIVDAITNTLDEDLKYLKLQVLDGNKVRTNLSYCYAIQGLLNSGLMYEKSVADSPTGGYCFSRFGLFVDKYALSYGEPNKYSSININEIVMGPSVWLDIKG